MEEQNLIFDIYNEDGTSFHGLSLKKATFSTEMMSLSDNITGDVYYPDNNLTFSFKEYITYKGVNYYLLLSAPPTIVKKGMTEENGDLKGMTKYSFTFYHPMAFLFNIPFTDIAVSNDEKKYKSENTTFYWIGTLTALCAKINKCLQGTSWTCSIQPNFIDKGTMSEVIQFQNQSIADVLKTGYETYHVPYVIDGYDILFGVPSNKILDETTNAPYIFKMGQGLGLRNNDRTPKNNAIITRIAGYGNTENIPFGYPKIKWTGNQAWDYTIDNDGADTESFPIIDGVINGENVRLIKHPFTRTELMPTIYVESVNKKVNPRALGYDPNTELIDYYDAKSVTYWQSEEPNYVFYTTSNAPAIGDNVYNADGTLFGTCTTDKRADYIIVNNLTCNLAGSYEYTNLINVNTPAYQKIAFDGSGDTADIKPTIVGATYNNQRIDLIKNIYWINDNKTPADAIDDTYDSKEGKYTQGYFKIEFYPLGFDLYAMAAVTSAMTVNMTNGACNACKFELAEDWDIVKSNFYYTKEDGTIVFDPNNQYSAHRDFTLFPDSTDISISVIVKKDINTFGTLMPNIYQQPKTGDSFVFTGIDMPDIRITEAQKILDNAMKQTMKEQNIAYYEYPLDFDVYFLTTHQYILNQIKTNCIVRFEYAGETLALSVKNYSISWGDNALPTYKITLTDDISITLNQIGQISEGLSKLGSQITALQSYYGKNILEELANKLSKTENDKAYGLITFLKGLNIGDGTNGIDSNGNATLNSIEIDDFVSKLSGGFFGKDINGNIYLETDKLYVRAKAYFENLEIIKTQYSYGNRIVGKGGIKVNNIEMLDVNGNIITDELQCNAYRCYFLTEQEGIKIYNPFIVGDQAIAKEFNIAEGNNTHVANHYLWRVVVSVGENYIDLSKDICDVNSDAPILGDELCQLGYRGDGNEDRTCAIMENIAGENVPSYIMLKGITNFSLSEKDILSMGYDNITGKAYFRVYGEAYIGDRERSNFFEFADGKATFNGEAHFKAGTDGGENISGITSSTTNLILNSGFSGNFETKNLNDNTTLEEATQMYSPSLFGWDGNATVKADIESLSGFSATITESISQTISAGLSVNNVYSFTCKAKGSFVTIKIAGNEYPFTLNTEYETLKIYVSPILGNTIEISGDCEICEPMLVLGGVFALWQRSPLDNDKATGIQVALSYLSEALQNDTTINGGLLTSTIIKLGRKILGEWEEAAGMSGIYNDDNDVAFYAGGTFKQAITTVIRYITNPTYKPTQLELQDMAKFVVTHGGRAILNDAIFRGIVYAEGGILRNIKTPNGSLNIDEDGNIEIEGKFSSGKNERKIVIDPELGNITMFDVFTNTEGILVTRPALRIDQTFLPNLPNLGLRPNVTVLGYAPNGDIWKTITLSTEGIIADIEDFSYHTYYNIGQDGISYNRIDKSKTENQSTLLNFGIGRDTDNAIDIFNLTCTSWPTYAQASNGSIYLENGYLKIK